MKYILTGSHGFIGQNLGKSLLLDKNVVKTIPRDLLTEEWNLKSYLESEQPDVIIHLAAYGNHSQQQDFLETISSNILVTSVLLNASKEIDYKAFINISTSSVNLPVQTFYSASKRSAELICESFVQKYNKNIVTIRPYSVYGPQEADFRFIPTVIRSINSGAEFNLVPHVKHDWIYINDFIQGVKLVIPVAERLRGKSVDVGTGRSYTNLEIVKLLEKISGKKANYTLVDKMRDYDTTDWVANTAVIEYLRFKQEYTLFDGLSETYEHY